MSQSESKEQSKSVTAGMRYVAREDIAANDIDCPIQAKLNE